MGQPRSTLTDADRAFIARQRLFFVATAPRSDQGLVNLSPKGIDGTFAVLDERTVAYLDLTGSGVETIAHLKENGRICIMFCAFDGPPMILRLHGRGEAIEPGHTAFDALRPRFGEPPGVRAIIRVQVTRVASSCGFGVPRYAWEGERTQFQDWAARKGEAGMAAYRRTHNGASLDGLPALAPTSDD